MREPIPPDASPETPPALPISPRKLTEPDAQFIRDITLAIRAGARVDTAAQWLGCTKSMWRRWKQRTGPVYDEMKTALRAAQAHVEIKLQTEVAKRNPGAALRAMRYHRTPDDAPVEGARAYHQTRLHALKRDLPALMARVTDDTIASDTLAPLEQIARAWRESVIDDCGGRAALTTAKLGVIQAALGSWLCLSTVDQYVLELAAGQGLVNRHRRIVLPIVEQRTRMADALVRQLQALGLDRKTAPAQSLDAYVAAKYGGRAPTTNGHVAPPEPLEPAEE